MIEIEEISPADPKAHRIVVMGPFHYADAEKAVAFAKEHLETGESANVLIDLTALADFSFSGLGDQLVHLPTMIQFVYSLDRIAIISDEDWLRSAARIESALLPRVVYQVYDDDEADAARAWVMGETDEPHRGAFHELDIGKPEIAAFEVTGRLDEAESKRGMAMIEEKLSAPDCSRLMMVIRNWHGFDAELIFSPRLMSSKMKLIKQFDRYAIVGGPDWVGGMGEVMGKLVKPTIKAFDLDELDDAVAWLSE